MAQTKIYPATKTQAENIQATVDEINSKVGGQLQVKTVMPSNVQQTVQADAGYSALSGVVVNPIAAAMPENLEDFILRKDTMPDFSLHLNGDIPNYACYNQTKLTTIYGEPKEIGAYAFYGCTKLNKSDWKSVTRIGNSAFYNCSLLATEADFSNANTVDNYAFAGCGSIININLKSAVKIQSYCFMDCPKIKIADCRSATTLGQQAFRHCKSMTIDIRNIPSINDGYLFSGVLFMDLSERDEPPILAKPSYNITYVLVKNDTVKALFQTATNWSQFADNIHTISEIEAETGMPYDEYYLQLFGHPRFDESEGE